jgi:hypothetical protein
VSYSVKRLLPKGGNPADDQMVRDFTQHVADRINLAMEDMTGLLTPHQSLAVMVNIVIGLAASTALFAEKAQIAKSSARMLHSIGLHISGLKITEEEETP